MDDDMIQQNTEHEGYDPALELLCTIPPHPDMAILAELQVDLGMNQKELLRLIGVLRDEGIPVRMTHAGERIRAVQFPRASWPLTRIRADAYWKNVYWNTECCVG